MIILFPTRLFYIIMSFDFPFVRLFGVILLLPLYSIWITKRTQSIKVGYIFQQNTEYQSGLYIPAKHRVSKWFIYSSKTQSIKVGYKFQQNTEYQSGLYIPAKHRVSKWVIYSSKTPSIKVVYIFQQNTEYQSGLYIQQNTEYQSGLYIPAWLQS